MSKEMPCRKIKISGKEYEFFKESLGSMEYIKTLPLSPVLMNMILTNVSTLMVLDQGVMFLVKDRAYNTYRSVSTNIERLESYNFNTIYRCGFNSIIGSITAPVGSDEYLKELRRHVDDIFALGSHVIYNRDRLRSNK